MYQPLELCLSSAGTNCLRAPKFWTNIVIFFFRQPFLIGGRKKVKQCYKRQMTSTFVKVIWQILGRFLRVSRVTYWFSTLVRRMRLELTRSCDHYPLKVACIPISPPALGCPEQDSNLHVSQHSHLKRARLPIPPSGLSTSKISA